MVQRKISELLQHHERAAGKHTAIYETRLVVDLPSFFTSTYHCLMAYYHNARIVELKDELEATSATERYA